MGLTGSYSDQTAEENGSQGVFKSIRLSYSPRFSRTYSLTGSVAWNEDDPLGYGYGYGYGGIPNNARYSSSSEGWYYSVQVGRPVNDRMALSVNYQFTDRQSDDSLNAYQENRVIATLSIRL